MAFLDGLSPLDNLFWRAIRPGSRMNLIGASRVSEPAICDLRKSNHEQLAALGQLRSSRQLKGVRKTGRRKW